MLLPGGFIYQPLATFEKPSHCLKKELSLSYDVNLETVWLAAYSTETAYLGPLDGSRDLRSQARCRCSVNPNNRDVF